MKLILATFFLLGFGLLSAGPMVTSTRAHHEMTLENDAGAKACVLHCLVAAVQESDVVFVLQGAPAIVLVALVAFFFVVERCRSFQTAPSTLFFRDPRLLLCIMKRE